MSDVALWLGVGLLGGGGAIARFLVDGIVSSRRATGFPLGTFVVNLSGALILGLLTGLAVHGDDLLLAGTAIVGSYTTFSTWLFESHRLAEDNEMLLLWANVLLSLTVGVLAVALGRVIG